VALRHAVLAEVLKVSGGAFDQRDADGTHDDRVVG
jgi:hypothetical protein